MNQKKLTLKKAFQKALFSFISIIPMLLGVVGLVGLMQIYITPDMLQSFFGYGDILDIFAGTFAGAISVGQGMISYVVADGLMQQGVSTYALSAFILSWVTLGFIQIPAEVSVFGVRFTIYRNILTIFSTILVAYFSVITTKIFS